MSAYARIEQAIAPEMCGKLKPVAWVANRREVSDRILRLALQQWQANHLPKRRTPATKHEIEVYAKGLAATVEAEYRQKYGVSIWLLIFIVPLCQFAVKKLLEWWFDAETQSVMKMAIAEVRGAKP